ncbi:MAG: leucine-rich repeat domain-containing protein [Muribaculaceae bacterium]|nr:leucine-rich repeat domain-containing protein [Muribaculaceae bacterium]
MCKAIGNEAFYGCESLKNIVLPSSLTYIGIKAFERCKSLRNLRIPTAVTSIGHWTFVPL